jgi:DNA repair exonuclease SbcCD ATPase subunit
MAVGLFGLILCWLSSKEFFKRESLKDIKELNSTIHEKEIYLKELEADCAKKKTQLDRLVDESIVCKHKLLEKSNLLRKKIDELHKVQNRLDTIKDKIARVESVERKNRELLEQIAQINREDSLNEYKKVSNSKELQRLRTIIIEKDKQIKSLREESYENALKRKSSYIEISKDQFQQIEKRLKEYKHRADILEYENSQLKMMHRPKKEFDFFEKINYSISNLKDVALSNIFRDNYEKIPKT